MNLRRRLAALSIETIRRLERQRSSVERSAAEIGVQPRPHGIPLSFAQERLWFLEELQLVGSAYTMATAVRMTGALDQDALQRSFARLVERHESLRTRFQPFDHKPIQIIDAKRVLRLEIADLTALDEEQRDAELLRLQEEATSRTFELATGPLLRAKLVRIAKDEHVLLLAMHHIVSDGWSMGVLFRELGTLYGAYVAGQPDPLPPLPIQYVDYALWQRQWLTNERLGDQLAYWRDHLKGAPALLELPLDRARPAEQSYAGDTVSFALGRELSAQLKALARQSDATLYMTLYAGFAVLLSRLSGSEDIVIGTAVANRRHADVEGLIGFFVNTLALQVHVDDECSVAELLRQVRELTLAGYAHQDVPFEQVIEALQPARSLSYSPLFQVMLTLQNATQSSLQLPGLTLTSQGTARATAKFDLTLSLQEGGEEIVGGLNYATALFDRATVERWAEYLRAVLSAMVRDVNARVGALRLLSESERQRVIDGFNPALSYPQERAIHELFEAQVERAPAAVAVIYEGEQLSYAQLNARANQLAHYLRELGVGPEERIGLCMERGLEMVVGLLGILKAGGAYVPLDPSYPSERLAYMLQDAAPRVIVTQQQVRACLPDGAWQVVSLDEQAQEIALQPTSNLSVESLGLTARNLAYVIYTSGSTGQPKGVMVEHAQVARLFAATQERFEFGSQDVWTLFHSYAFDFSVWEVWGALLYGGQLVVVPYLTTRSPQAFYQLLCERGVTVLNQTPSAFQQLISAQAEAARSGARDALRCVIFGGEALELHTLRPWVARRGVAQPALVNMYGITETTVHVTYRQLAREDIESGRSSVIGSPLGDLRAYLLDRHLQPVPVGVSGEIYIGGAGLARGYLNRPELTAQRFVRDPFSAEPGARMYRTGDLGRWRADGDLEYLGRNDQQVKIRGFRIELGEIEAQLSRHAGIKDAVVIAREDSPQQKRLVAYYTCNGTEAVSAEGLRDHIKSRVPEHMVPAAYVELAALPLTPNGKLDRKALPAPDMTTQLTTRYVPPRNELEQDLAVIWAEVLEVERVGIEDNFFALGGDSILSVQLAARTQALGLSCTVADVFRCQCIASLAAALTAADATSEPAVKSRAFELVTADELAALRALHDDLEDAYPLGTLQAGMHFHTELVPNSPVYHDVFSYCIEAEFHQRPFDRALQGLAVRHPILRTAFITSVEGRLLQVVHEAVELRATVDDLSAVPAVQQERVLGEWLEAERRRDFRWTQAPLLRVFVHVRGPTRFQYTLSFHHSILDGWSAASLQTELFSHYGMLLNGRDEPPPAPKSLYRDYIAREQQALRSATSERYWLDNLKDVSALALPRSNEVQQSGTGRTEVRHFARIDAAVGGRLQQHAKELGVHVRLLALAAHLKVMSFLGGQDDVVTGVVSHSRLEEEDGERALGLYLNTLPLRLKLENETWRSLVKRLQDQELSMLPHREYPLSRIYAQLGRADLLSTVFNYVQFHVYQQTRAVAGKGISSARGLEVTNFPLTAHFSQAPGKESMGLELVGDGAVLSQTQIERIGFYYEAAIEALAADLDALHRAARLLPAAELQALEQFNATAQPYAQDRVIHEVLEAQVERAPNAVAVTYRETQLSYAQLNARANQLAHYLRGLGVGPDARVGLCMERGLEMIVGVLGILKAGGAYVPLDPNYPADRLGYILEDASPRVIVTERAASECLPSGGWQLVKLDEQARTLAQQPSTNLTVGLTPSNLGYVIYTSGSTGQPKGVMVEHRGMCNLAAAQGSAFKVGPNSRVLLVASLNFDASVFEWIMALGSGATLCVAAREDLLPGEPLLQTLQRTQATHVTVVPSALSALPRGSELSELQTIVVAGEACSEELVQAWAPGRTFINAYGPTETTVWASYYECSADDRGAPPIGRPIANASLYILDSQGERVPVGVSGEIYIGGVGLARGYLNRPELTAQRFLRDPFSAESDARMYRTGDVGRWRADGSIEFLGRNDHQVKIRGFRIELGEIEAQLSAHTGVKEAVVIAREDVPQQQRLVAYFTCSGLEPVSAKALREHLESRVPEYMVPAAYVELEALPLSPNGKLDRKALPAPTGESLAVREYAAPRGEIEETLALIWQELLHVERVGRHDNFFELGGHSLLIMQLIERLRRVGLNAEVREVFSAADLATLAGAISGESQPTFVAPPNLIPERCEALTPEMVTLVALQPQDLERIVAQVPGGASNVQDIYPLTALQEGILFHHLLDDEGDAYVPPALLAVESRAALDRLLDALQTLIDRHDIMRTAVMWEGLPRPLQVVYRRASLPVEQLELDASADAVTQLKARMSPEHLRMDVREAPLLRAQIAADPASNQWYVMLLRHHLISDHVSSELISSELMQMLSGRSAALTKPAAYRPYVAQALAYAQKNEAEPFFRRQLQDIDEPTLPYGLANVHGDGRGILEHRQALEPALAEQIRSQARQLGVSAATLFHLAWALVVGRSSAREDVVFGSVLSGRLQGAAGVERVMGMFVNTLPVRVKLDGMRARAGVLQTHRDLVDLVQHEQASLAVAQRASGVPAGTPLFSALLNYRHTGPKRQPASSSARAAIRFVADLERTNYPFSVSVDDLNTGFVLTTQVEQSVDPRCVAESLQQALAALVDALEHSPERLVLELDVLSASERRRVLEEFNATTLSYPQERAIHELFEAQVERAPHAVAVMYEEQQLSYAQLNTRANQLAHYLRGLGVGPDERVGLCMERGLEMVVGLLGILKAGGAYVPLDPSYPSERLAYMLQDAAPRVIVTQQQVRQCLPDGTWQVVTLDGQARAIAQQPSTNLSTQALGLTAKHLAYVIYTSGSTGQPKGVMVEHAQVARLFAATQERFEFGPQDVWTLFHSYAFDFSVWELWGALLYGGRLVVVPYLTTRSPQAFYQLLCERGVTVLNQTPSAFQQLMSAEAEAAAGGGTSDALRCVIFGGEALELHTLRPWVARRGVAQPTLVNMYGITETTVHVTYRQLDREDIESGRSSVIGRPLGDLRAYLLDRHLQPVPVGVSGEIYIGGAGVARGYLNRPELTAQRFVRDPFSAEPDTRMYRTGDLGRWRAEGELEYLGRNDHQVKIRGFRIELGEIEAQLSQHAGIKDVVVIAREDSPQQKRLVAYYVRHPEGCSGTAAVSAEGLRDHIKSRVPEHMVPAAYVELAALPLTPNGKLDRKALPQPGGESVARQEYEAPRGEIEETLALIWQELLQLERVGRHDHFFELGGHSLLVMQLIEQLRRVGLRAQVRSVFQAPRLAELAREVSSDSAPAFVVPPNLIPEGCEAITPEMLTLATVPPQDLQRIVAQVPGGAGNVQDIYPLVPLQQGILFHHILGNSANSYVQNLVLAFDTRAEAERFVTALNAVIARHDIFRTAVYWEGLAEPLQVVQRQAPLRTEEVRLPPGESPIAAMRALCSGEHGRIDITRAPLLRAKLGQAESGRWLLGLMSHHLIEDFSSLNVIGGEIDAFASGRAQNLPAVVPFRNFVARTLALRAQDDGASYFRELLRDVSEPTRPFELAETRDARIEIREAAVELDHALAAQVVAAARRFAVTPASVFHLAWALALGRCAGRDDVVFGTVLSGRLVEGEQLSGMVGLLINTLPLRLRLVDNTVQQALASVHRILAELAERAYLGLTDIKANSSFAAADPLFVALINCRKVQARAGGGSATGARVVASREQTNYPLTLCVDDYDGRFVLTGQSHAAIDPSRIIGFVSTALESIVAALERSPDRSVLGLQVMPVEELQALEQFNATAQPYAQDRVIHEVFEAQVERAPNVVAVTYRETQLSYAQLNARANQLAHYLRGLGVGPDERVGLCMERGLEMIVGVLGILKAGGAYVPLDPNYPADRLGYILEDASPRVIVTERAASECLPSGGWQLVKLDEQARTLAQQPSGNLDVGLTPSNLGYVIYTSGSTGQPKGVMVEHRGMCNLAAAQGSAFKVGPNSRVLLVASLNFDASVFEWIMALGSGATLCVAAREDLLPGEPLLHTLQRTQATHVTVVPSALSALPRGSELSELQTIVVAGEACSEELVQAWAPGRTFINAYGPTETTVWASYYECSEQDRGAPPIGGPIANASLYILDSHGERVPVGVSGEIYIGGVGLARGYLNRPELTAQRFLRDPFSAEPGARMYRTGDVGRWRADGSIEFLGRNDHQVKIRGFRIELGEIEAQLSAHAGVKEAVVIAREDVPQERRLVAYFTCSGHEPVSAKALREHLQSRVPEYMVPTAYVELEALPLSPNGKLDRKALPAPTGESLAVREYAAPQGEIEETLAQIWQELLHLERVGRDDNFFELGGHSLLLVKMLSQLRLVFNVELSMQHTGEAATLSAMAATIRELELRAYDADDLARIATDIDALSEDELLREYARQNEQRAGGSPPE